MTPPALQHRLVLLRHAKSAYPHGVPDHDRPLAGKGRRNAQAAGEWFRAEGPRPDLVLCSTATRARHTWEIVAGQLQQPVTMRLEPQLYDTSVTTMLSLARGVPESVGTLVMVGHEPSMSSATLLLAGEGSDETALTRVAAKFPTSAVAVLRWDAAWSQIALGHAVLERFAIPRA